RPVKATGTTSQLFATATFLIQTDWPKFGYDHNNSHFNPYENTTTRGDVRHVTFYWRNTIGEKASGTSAFRSSPVEVNGIVYIGSSAGNSLPSTRIQAPSCGFLLLQLAALSSRLPWFRMA